MHPNKTLSEVITARCRVLTDDLGPDHEEHKWAATKLNQMPDNLAEARDRLVRRDAHS